MVSDPVLEAELETLRRRHVELIFRVEWLERCVVGVLALIGTLALAFGSSLTVLRVGPVEHSLVGLAGSVLTTSSGGPEVAGWRGWLAVLVVAGLLAAVSAALSLAFKDPEPTVRPWHRWGLRAGVAALVLLLAAGGYDALRPAALVALISGLGLLWAARVVVHQLRS